MANTEHEFIRSPLLRRVLAYLILFACTLTIFSGVLEGKLINNGNYLYAYEPWAHHTQGLTGNYNYVLSDDMDAMSMSYPSAAVLRSGRIPLWNHYWQLGIPEFRIDSGWFYPLRIFWVAFGVPAGMTIEVLLRFFLAGVCTFLLLELLGVPWLISIVAAIGYVFGSNSIGDYMYGFGPIGLALPLAVYAVERVIRFGTRKDIVFLTLSLVVLNTHIMIHVNAVASMWVGIYALLRLLGERERGRLFKQFAIAIGFAPLLFAFALSPTLDFYLNYFNDSYRSDYSLAQLPLGGLLSLFFGKFFGDPLFEPQRYIFGTYINSGVFIGFLAGTAGIALAVLRLLRNWGWPLMVLWLVVVGLLVTIYKLPHESAEVVFKHVPMLQFVKPFYQKLVFQFFVLLVGALGLDFLWRLPRSRPWSFSLGLLALLGAAVLGPLWGFSYYYSIGESETQWDYLYWSSIINAGLVLAFLLCRPSFTSRFSPRLGATCGWIGAILLIGGTLFEAKYNSLNWIPYGGRGKFYPPTETTDFLLKNVKQGRVVSLDRAAVPGLLYGYGLSVAAGRSLPRAPYLELLRLAYPELHRDHPTQSLFSLAQTDLLSPVWNLANVNYFVGSKEINVESLRQKYGNEVRAHQLSDGTVLERRAHARPFVASYSVTYSDGIGRTKELIVSGFDTKKSIIVTDERLREILPTPCDHERPSVRRFRFDLNSVSFELRNRCPAYVLLSMFHDRGWIATVDGVEQPVYQGYGFMPVLKIDTPGSHRIQFRYLPKSIVYGVLISLVSLALYVLIVWKFAAANRSSNQ